ncbi:Histone-lysine N-methyltransferase, H3 lysine-79 specific [Penicillium ucsense]|uniref:Histone-lysine N-methyltransferase, H3 lysine-79 specific n=1 Tax=Penicillium ucsense TaxID=2839758 RepID=A0A8J8WMC6_9EURO|nr:Histone-lysine N-methyltransferase, H3 lysine-79 specific [Penicillium ucsense]KAF7739441.1 Histone-lysine N-methyltransferase, H3 lysine-79 specific [Penicillium ucsense]
MGFFDHLQKGGAFSLQAKKTQVRKVVQTKPAAPSNPSVQNADSRPPRAHSSSHKAPKARSVSSDADPRPSKRLTTPSRPRKRPTPDTRLSSDDDDVSDSDTSFEIRKRAKVSAEPDPERRIRSAKAFSEDGSRPFKMVHAADITSGDKAGKFKPAFGAAGKSKEILLQYPSASRKERFDCMVPKDNDEFRPIDDIVQVIETVADHYIPSHEAAEFNDETTGIRRRLRRAIALTSETQFRDAVEDYNKSVDRLRIDASIAKVLDETQRMSLPWVERILNQTYARTVSPRVESLRQYENGTDNVYGELLPRFISDIFKETKLKSGHVFVDLGSGVGNVVLQAALEIGCESWGCEMMANACDLAELQQAEFKARCRLWGILPGKTHLVRGDFLEQESIINVLKRADVVLINNQAFTPQLNNELINHFLDMKEGCKIVSLKSFVPAGHKIQSRNLNSPINLLRVQQKNYWSNSVSWTDVGGTYFIATKDSSRLKAFIEDSP